jgi:pimeloyl-ACP methyl ester carboxylesterase
MCRHSEAEMVQLLSQIQAPTLVITPEAGLVSNSPMMASRKAAMAKLVVIPLNAGHHIHLSHPHDVASTINDFLANQQG